MEGFRPQHAGKAGAQPPGAESPTPKFVMTAPTFEVVFNEGQKSGGPEALACRNAHNANFELKHQGRNGLHTIAHESRRLLSRDVGNCSVV